jgi:hypothetical protein
MENRLPTDSGQLPLLDGFEGTAEPQCYAKNSRGGKGLDFLEPTFSPERKKMSQWQFDLTCHPHNCYFLPRPWQRQNSEESGFRLAQTQGKRGLGGVALLAVLGTPAFGSQESQESAPKSTVR